MNTAVGTMTPPRAANARSRVTSPPTPLVNANSYRSMILLEKKRKSHEVATTELKNEQLVTERVGVYCIVLLEETLDGLRKKAEELQLDNWMYQDVRFG